MKKYLKGAKVTLVHRQLLGNPLTIFGFTTIPANEDKFEIKPRRKRGEPEPTEPEAPPEETTIADYYRRHVSRSPSPSLSPSLASSRIVRACANAVTASRLLPPRPVQHRPAAAGLAVRRSALPSARRLSADTFTSPRLARSPRCVDLKEKRMRVPVELAILLPGQPVGFTLMQPDQTAAIIKVRRLDRVRLPLRSTSAR